jgi:hypothetical protein
MSNDPGNPIQPHEGLSRLRELLAKHLGVALSSMLGEQVETVEASDPPIGDLHWFRQTFVPVEGSLWFGMAKSDAISAGETLLTAAGLTGETPETAVQALSEILSQASGALASDYAAKLRKGCSPWDS